MDSAVVQTEVARVGLADLAQRVVAGDRQAEAELLLQFERGVRLLARRHCRANDPAAEDIAQDVLCTLIERVRSGTIREAQALPAYVRTMVVHAVSAEYRRRRLREERHVSDPLDERVRTSHGPAEQIEAERLASAFRRVLAELPVQRDREVLRRFYLLDQGKDEVCAALDIPAGHFHRVIHRARQRFGEALVRAGITPDED